MSDSELRNEADRISQENNLKAQQMIANKLKKLRGEIVEEPVTEVKRMSYEEAKAVGDVRLMLKYKLGDFDREDRAKEQEALFNGSIVDIANEYKGIGNLISEQKLHIENEIAKAKSDIKAKYEREIADSRARGHMRGSSFEIAIEDSYYKALEGIEKLEHIKASNQKLESLISRRYMLRTTVEKYKADNHELLAQEMQRRKLLEINQSNILDLMMD